MAARIVGFGRILWLVGQLLWLAAASQAWAAESPHLTQEERDWIIAHPTIHLGTDKSWQPYAKLQADGSVVGIEADILARVNALTGANIKLVLGQWSEIVAQAERGELEGLALSVYHPERAQTFLFSSSPYKSSRYIYVRGGRNSPLRSMGDLRGKRVGVIRGHLADHKMLARWPEIIPVDESSYPELALALANGEVDAVICSIGLELAIREELISGLGIGFRVPDGDIEFLYSIRKEHPQLLSIINKALESMGPVEIQDILRKWGAYRGENATEFVLSDVEKAWLREHPVVRTRIFDLPPINYWENGPQGIAVDLAEAILGRLGVRIEYQHGIGWVQTVEDIRRHEGVDLLLNAKRTPQRENFLAFSQDHMVFPWLIFTRTDELGIFGLDDLVGKTLAVERGYALQEILAQEYPHIKLALFDDTSAALWAVSNKQADAYIGILPVVQYHIVRRGLSNIKVAAGTPLGNYSQAFAARNDWPELASILDKGLDAMPVEERNGIARKYSSVEMTSRVDYTLLWEIVGCALSVILAISYWNRRLSREINLRRQAESQYREMSEDLEKRVEERTRDLREIHRQLLSTQFAMEKVGIGIAWNDMEGRFLYVNDEICNQLGYARVELLELAIADVSPDFQQPRFRELVETLRTANGRFRVEANHRRKNGSFYPVEAFAYLQHSEGREWVVFFFSDITARKQAETDLLTAKEAAESANRAKSVFLANMSHELRTPMNGIMGMVLLAKRRMTDAKGLEQLGKATASAEHLLKIIDEILDLSKIEAERLTLESIEFTLGTVLENLKALVGPRAAKKGVALRLELPPSLTLCPLRGDPLRLGQILINLVGNAIKFTDHGSVTVAVAALSHSQPNEAKATVHWRTESIGGSSGQNAPLLGAWSVPDAPVWSAAGENAESYGTELLLRFEVRDTGIGISAEDSLRLFNAFEQADGSSTRRYGGTGLGLAISKRLAKLMGGDIGLESEPGRGSTFWFTVRLSVAQPKDWASKPDADEGGIELEIRTRFGGLRTLLVEDEPISREVACGVLEDLGLVVDLAADGQEALMLARQNAYALILMDMQMPKLNGIDATRAIRSDSLNIGTPILAMTANVFDKDRQACLDAGMNAHMGKPLDIDVLHKLLLEWLAVD